jgi:hypothetical protein
MRFLAYCVPFLLAHTILSMDAFEYGSWRDWLLCMGAAVLFSLQMPLPGSFRIAASFIGRHIWQWQVVLTVSSLLLGAGLTAMLSDAYIAAIVFYTLGIAYITAKSLTSSQLKQHESGGLIAAFILLAGIALLGGALWWNQEHYQTRRNAMMEELAQQANLEFLAVCDRPIDTIEFAVVLDRNYTLSELGEFRALLRIQAFHPAHLDYLWFSLATTLADDDATKQSQFLFAVKSSVWYDDPAQVLEDMILGQSNDSHSQTMHTEEYVSMDSGPILKLNDFDKRTFELYITKSLWSHTKNLAFIVNGYDLLVLPHDAAIFLDVDKHLDNAAWPVPLTNTEREGLVQLVRPSHDPQQNPARWWLWDFQIYSPPKQGSLKKRGIVQYP